MGNGSGDVLIDVARQKGKRLLDVLLPQRCPLTNEPLAHNAGLSADAWARLHLLTPPCCSRCGAPFAIDYGDNVECAACLAEPPAYDSARAAGLYDDASHRLIVSFKHSDRTDIAPLLGKLMATAGAPLLSKSTRMVPIPLHRKRLIARRYNQSVLLARALEKETGAVALVDPLVRIRSTPPQKQLSADARKRNVAGAFQLRDGARHSITGKHIVLIDDVLTTGATLSAAARVLKKAGAARVDALVAARVVKGGLGAI